MNCKWSLLILTLGGHDSPGGKNLHDEGTNIKRCRDLTVIWNKEDSTFQRKFYLLRVERGLWFSNALQMTLKSCACFCAVLASHSLCQGTFSLWGDAQPCAGSPGAAEGHFQGHFHVSHEEWQSCAATVGVCTSLLCGNTSLSVLWFTVERSSRTYLPPLPVTIGNIKPCVQAGWNVCKFWDFLNSQI